MSDEFVTEVEELRVYLCANRAYERRHPDDWIKAASAMFALEQTHSAILAFAEPPRDGEREAGERHLRAYGVMQAFVIQQDATKDLFLALGLTKPDLSSLEHIRDIRVAVAGHPTLQTLPKSIPTRWHFTFRPFLLDKTLQVTTMGGLSKLPMFRHVEILDLAAEQEKHILGLLRTLVPQMILIYGFSIA